MIHRACYVACDSCHNPAEISVKDAEEARLFARQDGFIYVRRAHTLLAQHAALSRMVDLCPRCRNRAGGAS